MKYAKRTQKYVNFDTAAEAASTEKFDLIQPKHDGWWACVHIKNEVARVFSRQAVLKATVEVPKATDCILLGEYLVGTQRAKQSKDESRLVVFDVLEVEGCPVYGETYEKRMSNYGRCVTFVDWMQRVESVPVRLHRQAWSRLVEKEGAEGLVFRHSLDPYDRGVIGRVKQTFTMDYVVMGLQPGEGKHKGRMGAVICGLYEGKELVEKVRVGGGWSDQERDSIWKRPQAYVGRVLEVRGYQVFDSGSMRHPNAVRFRDDKDARECVYTKKEVK